MTQDRSALEHAVAALEAQRGALGDAVVGPAIAALRERIAAIRAESGELRPLTILFVDAVGSTAMGQRLDPEAMHDVLAPALRRFAASVR